MPKVSLARWQRPLLVVTGIAAMVLLLAWLMGAFHHRMPAGPALPGPGVPVRGERLTLQPTTTPRFETAIGTVRAVHETIVASRVLGRVASLAITRAGQPVQKDELLCQLEAEDLQAGLDAARAALQVAVTRRDKAKLDFDRTQSLVGTGAAAPEKLDTDKATLAAAEAEVEHARQGVAGAESALGFATIKAPITGIVVDKQVQVGDVVQPGQPICTLYDPTRLQLVAVVREELAGRLQVGQDVSVRLDALQLDCRGTVAEIVPSAQAASRSFEVKVTGPCHDGVVTGMFGRLFVPLGETRELLVPARAVQSIGQLDFVQVAEGERAVRRLVRLGRPDGDHIEVLSGLAAGEVVVVPPADQGEGR
ncbi:MAG: efflux RND transporter periplasmic adaptor subunit [Planctomycetes bacterium]|nr:efflux RND transporter periplasmic adaptor subunit [Planctomycetota bacterium]